MRIRNNANGPKTGETNTELREGPAVMISNAVNNLLDSPSMPFIPALNKLPLVRSLECSMLIVQLEQQFMQHPNGFFMFYEPQIDDPDYNRGESLRERLCVSACDIKLAFDKIGVRYDSPTEYEEAGTDAFRRKYYCSVYDRKRDRALYLRNHNLIERDMRATLDGRTVAEIYSEFIKQDKERKSRIREDIESGKYGAEVNILDILAACTGD